MEEGTCIDDFIALALSQPEALALHHSVDDSADITFSYASLRRAAEQAAAIDAHTDRRLPPFLQ